MGIVVTFDGIAEAVFPLVVGKMHDQTHSYGTGFKLLAAVAALGAVAIAPLARPPAPAGRRAGHRHRALERGVLTRQSSFWARPRETG
jgi:hypothetical protein